MVKVSVEGLLDYEKDREIAARNGSAGRPIEDDQLYTIATIDYPADGKRRDDCFASGREKRECPDGATLRGLFMDYVERQTAAGKKITSRLEGRVTVKDE